MDDLFFTLPKSLISLAESLSSPLYAVGGYVRNYIIDKTVSDDFDISAPIGTDIIIGTASRLGIKVVAEYKRTGTVVLSDGKNKFEFTSFRKDSYFAGGVHRPNSVEFTDDIVSDAKRRDFKCNAVYYDVKNKRFVDPLNGIEDIFKKALDTTIDGDTVFSADGLRLMRLARFSAELNFIPTKNTLDSAKKYADNVLDVSSERILVELNRILRSDEKYGFSTESSPKTGLDVLNKIGVLDRIILNYKGVSDSLKEKIFTEIAQNIKDIRLALLLSALKDETALGETLSKLKVDGKTKKLVVRLYGAKRLYDMNKSKRQEFIIDNYDVYSLIKEYLGAYLRIYCDSEKSRTFTAELDEIKSIVDKKDIPLNVRQLKITAKDLTGFNITGREIGKTLKGLLCLTQRRPELNEKEKLIEILKKGKWEKL